MKQSLTLSAESYKKHIEILFLKPGEKPLLVIDKEKIRVVLQNLIENAIKYSVAGDKVFISVENKNDVIYISVKDSGIGIPENEKNQIFQKFFRGTLTHDIPGTGLGLILSKPSSSITAVPFLVTDRRNWHDIHSHTSRVNVRYSTLSHEQKVSIIEDDSFLSGLEAGKLQKEGFEVLTAANGADGRTIRNKSQHDRMYSP